MATVNVYPDSRYQPPITPRCHETSAVKCWLTSDGKGLRIECEQCGMLVIDFKIKSPIIRRHKSK